MAASTKAKPKPKWVIDLHGMREVLTTKQNSIRAAVIDAISNGEMQILRSVSNNLKDLYPELYEDFKAIEGKKYLAVTIAVSATASSLAEEYGTSLLGSIPTMEQFEAVAASIIAGVTLVSAGKALNDCKGIAKKCKLGSDCVIPISAVQSEAPNESAA